MGSLKATPTAPLRGAFVASRAGTVDSTVGAVVSSAIAVVKLQV
jgi:hypothetical protein